MLARIGSATWVRRLGAGAFLFFLVKGLLWLLIPAAVVLWQALSGGGGAGA